MLSAVISNHLGAPEHSWTVRLAGIACLVLLALILRFVVHQVINWVCAWNGSSERAMRSAGLDQHERSRIRERRRSRAQALGATVKKASTVVIIYGCLSEAVALFQVNMLAFHTSAGVFGIALALGAQSLIRDVFSGICLVFEDQFEIGDLVTIGQATGAVVAIRTRTTTLQNSDGVIWHVRNGDISIVGNLSKGFALAIVDIPVDRASDFTVVSQLVEQAVREFVDGHQMAKDLLETPRLVGIDSINPTQVILRLEVKVKPGCDCDIRREISRHILAGLSDSAALGPTGG
ncbi:mechanosensitive ion channel [Mycobacteroides abscessus subsp. massiliense]|uniref:mechanosensitive ion channel family protein n=1 Tax=Mycobacteroides abscessus TaxID=36809 RepID=UPI0019D303E0|nr:mechanosensitive ion channel domain-containing protein [Mycobacteroides abscessus]MBN7321813.1 mechanosensitive ion channel [Mycobacteroides abscessus subsp. massiliense]